MPINWIFQTTKINISINYTNYLTTESEIILHCDIFISKYVDFIKYHLSVTGVNDNYLMLYYYLLLIVKHIFYIKNIFFVILTKWLL